MISLGSKLKATTPSIDITSVKWILVCLALVTHFCTFANDDTSSVKVSGFGTLGFVYNPSGQFDYLRDLQQENGAGATRKFDFGVDSLFGLQLSAKPTENLDTTIQIVGRRAQEGFRPQLTWAFASYTPSENWTFRGGRLGVDMYLQTDSRNVAFSYPWVRPPVDFFGSIIFSSMDGADFVYRHPLGSSQFKLKFSSGLTNEQVPTNQAGLHFDLSNSRLVGIYTELQSPHWLTRLSYATFEFNKEFPQFGELSAQLQSPQLTAISPFIGQIGRDFTFKDKKVHYVSAGVAYDDGPLQAQAMLSRINSGTLGFASNTAAYLTLTYRIRSWTPYATISFTRPHDFKEPQTGLPQGLSPQLDYINNLVSYTAHSTLSKQNTLTLGVRYSINDTSDIKLQWDHINNTYPLLLRKVDPRWNGSGNIFSCAINFIF